jgi:hypothetical protein
MRYQLYDKPGTKGTVKKGSINNNLEISKTIKIFQATPESALRCRLKNAYY